MSTDELVRIVQSLGLPVVAIFAICWAAYKAIIWLASSVVKPLLDRHLKHLDEFREHMQRNDDNMDRLCSNQDTITRGLTKLFDSDEFRNMSKPSRGKTPPPPVK